MKKMIAGLLLGLCMNLSAWATVNLNTATQSELESVKGIGPSKAKDILAYREKNGAFKSLDDLANVKGFGKASVQKLKAELTVGEAANGARK